MADPLPFGDFLLHQRLGQGGMGVVFKAQECASGRWVALKLGLPELLLSEARAERFRREGEIAASLQHPHLVRVHAAGVVEGRPYLAFELVEGCRTLEALAGAPLRDRVGAIRDVARALGHAHARGVTHRDVKPENVLIDREGVVRLADFGVALAQDQERLTRTGALVGTPYYMAPESITGGRDADGPRGDVYALGAVLFELLAGQHPFADQGPAALLNPSVRRIPPLRALAPEVPPALAAICERALATNPAARPADGDALADALDAWLEGRSRGPRRWLPAAALALGLAALAGGTPGRAARRSPSPPAPAPSPTRPTGAGERAPSRELLAALALARAEPLDVEALQRALRGLTDLDLGGEASTQLADAVLAHVPDGRQLRWPQALALWEALAAAGCRAGDRERAEALVDELCWGAYYYGVLDLPAYRLALVAFVELDIDLSGNEVEAMLPEDLPADAVQIPGPGPAAAYVAARLRALRNDAPGRLKLRELGADPRLGPRTRARALVEGWRLEPVGLDQAAQAVDLDPHSPWALALLAQALREADQREPAQARAREAVARWAAQRNARRSENDFYRRRFFDHPGVLETLLEVGDREGFERALAVADAGTAARDMSAGSKYARWRAHWRARLDAGR